MFQELETALFDALEGLFAPEEENRPDHSNRSTPDLFYFLISQHAKTIRKPLHAKSNNLRQLLRYHEPDPRSPRST